MRVDRITESLHVVRDLGLHPAREVAAWIQCAYGDRFDVQPCLDSVAVRGDPSTDFKLPSGPVPSQCVAGRRFVLPVLLNGPDFGLVQPHLDALVHATYRVECIGFLPGFPYCSGVPGALSHLVRRPEPRPRVPPGSVAIAAGMLGIYPQASPGGWNLIGTTPAIIADPAERFFALAPGDRLTLRVISEPEAAPFRLMPIREEW